MQTRKGVCELAEHVKSPQEMEYETQLEQPIFWLSVKALAGPCRTEPTIALEVGIRRITVFRYRLSSPS